jgi:hypothetical protein
MNDRQMNNFYQDDWISPIISGQNIEWHLSKKAQEKILSTELIKLQVNSKLSITNLNLGDNPYVALSGGVDSQAACLLLKNAGRLFKAAIAVFGNNFNKEDVLSAKNFCYKHKIEYVEIEIDVLSFLTSELVSYSTKYSCPSPQISVHLKFFELLIQIFKPTCIIAGGNSPYLCNGSWTFGSSRSQSAWMNFKTINNCNIIGNFLGHSLEIALPVMLSSLDFNKLKDDYLDNARYTSKVEGMLKLGLAITRQTQKFTGFEEIKTFFDTETKEYGYFDKCFRRPLYANISELYSKLILTPDISDHLLMLHAEFNKYTMNLQKDRNET